MTYEIINGILGLVAMLLIGFLFWVAITHEDC